MLNNLKDKVDCEICGGKIELSELSTIDEYAIMITVNSSNIFSKIDEIIGRYLVYECVSCSAKYKYTYKDLEKVLRKNITQKMLIILARGGMLKNNAITDKLFFYCGKCNGFDGLGSCPKVVYNNCEIKRFPLNEL